MEERTALVSINSASRANRSGTSPNNYISTFGDLSDVFAIQIISAEIPNGQYQVNQYNSALDVSINGAAAQTTYIGVGNYSVTDLALAVQSALQDLDINFTVSFSSITDRLQIEHAILPFALLFASGPSRQFGSASLIGFSKDFDFESKVSGLLNVAIAPYIVQLQGDPYVYICLQGIGTIGNSEGIPDVAAKVVFPTATRTASLNSLVAPIIKFDAVLGIFRSLHVSLCRPDGTLYDCNNMDHSFTLQVWQMPAQYYY